MNRNERISDVDCPVSRSFETMIDSAQQYTRAARNLRRSLQRCKQCVLVDDCSIRARFGEKARAAILDVQKELGLIKDDRTE